MKIILSPQRRDDAIEVFKAGDILTINGEAFDFSSIPAGGGIFPDEDTGESPVPCEWIIGSVTRTQQGDLQIKIINPTGPIPTQAADWPAPIINPPDGRVDIPYSTHEDESRTPAPGGENVTVTRYVWGHPPEVVSTWFVPEGDQMRAEETPDDMEA